VSLSSVSPQSKEEAGADGQMVKLSKVKGKRKIDDEGERREMITPALRKALTKQGKANGDLNSVFFLFEKIKKVVSLQENKKNSMWSFWVILWLTEVQCFLAISNRTSAGVTGDSG